MAFGDLVAGQSYRIHDLRTFDTKYRLKVVADLEDDRYAYLPARISKTLLEANNELLIDA